MSIVSYQGASLHMVPELQRGRCTGCCFMQQALVTGCNHAATVQCRESNTIAVRDLEQYQIDYVTFNLTGELP